MSPAESESLLRFRRALDTLKQEGSAILVVGEVPHGGHRALCDQMLGHGQGEYRRVLVETDAGCSAAAHDHGPENRVLTYAAGTRSAAAATTTDGPELTDALRSVADLVDALEVAVDEAAAAVDDHTRLRVCVDSLLPLISDSDREQVFRVLHPLCAQLRSVGGMGHCHLPVPGDAEVVRLYRPLFDAVIELRINDGVMQQRWDLVERDVESEWLDVTYS